MTYTTSVLSVFDEQLFEECYADSNQGTIRYCFADISAATDSGRISEDRKKELVKAAWCSNNYQTLQHFSFKISNDSSDIAYIIAKQFVYDTRVDVVLVHVMYKTTGISDTANNYWLAGYNKLHVRGNYVVYQPHALDFPASDYTTINEKPVNFYVPAWALSGQYDTGADT